jgi:hypothetical protein
MRRIAIAALMLAALAAAFWACSSDAPTPTPPNQGGGGTKGTPLVITLFTTNANPTAGGCTLVQAIVTFNGKAVDDGTGVSFSTDFGVFSANLQPVVSIVTTKGSAIATLCSSSAGIAFVNASAFVGGVTAKADALKIVFQSSSVAVPFFSSCVPSFAPATGGTPLTINGGRFPVDVNGSTTRATFTAAGVTREATVTSVSANAVNLVTPAFPEAVSPSVPVAITLIFFANSGSPLTLAVPNCFAFGSVSPSTPKITAILPASGTKEGGTRVSIIGSGFSAPLQVFFGVVEAQVISVTFNQIVVLTPAAFLFGPTPPINTPIDVRVHEVTSGTDGVLAASFTYVLPLQITAIDPLQMRVDSLRTLTIFGHGFQAPISVTVAGIPASVVSVSDTEVLVLPGTPGSCGSGGGGVSVTLINTGETATSSQSFTYVATPVSIASLIPNNGTPGTSVTITGTNLPTNTASADVRFGGAAAAIVSVSGDGTSMVVTAPSAPPGAAPTCPNGTAVGTPLASGAVTVTVRNLASGCAASSSFTYLLPCVVADLVMSNAAPATVVSGNNMTISLTVTNVGGAASASTTVTATLDAGNTLVSCTPTQGGPCVGSTVNFGTVAAGASAKVDIVVNVTAPATTVLTNMASVTTTTTEINLGNNSANSTTTVN